MPIIGPAAFTTIRQAEFSKLDYQVMSLAFDSQNQLGRLCEEKIYQNDLAQRLARAGLHASTEVPVVVAHESFSKTYSIDLIVEDAAIYELKTSLALSGAHEAQLLNYLFLSEAHHGKLLNFRPAQVESRFVNTALTLADRRQLIVEDHSWVEHEPTDEPFRNRLLSLLRDWGSRLELALFTEAMIHFSGGESNVVRRLTLTRDATCLGVQCFHLLSPETAFRLTALSDGFDAYARQLLALLRLNPLRAIQWVNLDGPKIRFQSLTR